MLQKFKLTSPVLFLVFNRPDTTKKVFEEIRKAKPTKLFIAADGPRNLEEKKKTNEVRKIVSNVDWPCKVKTLFRDKNLGCKYSVSGAIDWFFKNVEYGIILEDDCLPSQSFFRFCQEMLIRYKDDKRIMHISGTNIEGELNINESYIFSDMTNVWGWATWKRAWEKYDAEMKEWKSLRFTKKFFKITKYYPFFTKIKSWRLYQLTYKDRIDTWDYQWDFICRINNGLSIISKQNQISNLGLGIGTHTKNYGKERLLRRYEMKFPLSYNNKIKVNLQYLKSYLKFFSTPILSHIIKHKHI